MEDLSLHVLDVVENSIKAGAARVSIEIREDTRANRLEIVIEDDGAGMTEEMARKVRDPFVTTRTERRVGLGIPLLADSARETGGDVEIWSEPGKGTRVRVWFVRDHIDRKPMGDMAGTMAMLITGNSEVDFRFLYERNQRSFEIDTAEIRGQLEDIPINDPAVAGLLGRKIKEGMQEIISEDESDDRTG